MIEHLFASVEAQYDALVDLRRDLLAHPELAFKEVRTASRLSEVKA